MKINTEHDQNIHDPSWGKGCSPLALPCLAALPRQLGRAGLSRAGSDSSEFDLRSYKEPEICDKICGYSMKRKQQQKAHQLRRQRQRSRGTR